MFCDITKLTVIAGKGGNGCMSFRREKYLPKGGPDGGNGGAGGAVVFEATDHLNSLIEHRSRRKYEAPKGEQGYGWKKAGANAEDLVLRVPTGTVIKDQHTDEVLADLNEHGMRAIIAEGGRGGYGNEHFKSSTRQAPRFAELGEPGETKDIVLELKLVADIGIIGLPSAGKSTLISVLTACKPKIADYPFTTLIPNLGVAKLGNESIVIADIPGLIEGASEGKGLGDEFLRHISRNSTLVHVVDLNAGDPAENYKIIQKELEAYGEGLADKKQILVFNKIDGEDKDLEKMILKEFKEKVDLPKDVPVFFISALMHIGLDPLLGAMIETVKEEKAKYFVEKKPEEIKIYTPHEEENPRYYEVEEVFDKDEKDEEFVDLGADWEERVLDQDIEEAIGVEEEDKPRVFQIKGKRINQIAIMTNFQNPEGVQRLWDVCKKLGIWNELEIKFGAKKGDRVCFERFEGFIPYREKMDLR